MNMLEKCHVGPNAMFPNGDTILLNHLDAMGVNISCATVAPIVTLTLGLVLLAAFVFVAGIHTVVKA